MTDEPFIIHYVSGRYLIFDVSVLKHLREVHNICGVLIGTLPQIAQQNVFLGLPLELMVEEAVYLVRKSYAYIVDDTAAHRESVSRITPSVLSLHQAERDAARARKDAATRSAQMQRKRAAMEKRGLTMNEYDVSSQDVASTSGHVTTVSPQIIYDPPKHSAADLSLNVPAARYNLYKHLHELDYFLTPGLRFGAQYVAYPGDPLRFHSHFIASGHDWEEAIPVMDIVGGGRLGTGVKKAWLVGAEDPATSEMKCFTVEWAGM